MSLAWMETYQNTQWNGQAELWTDPAGHETESSSCSVEFLKNDIHYQWAYRGTSQHGSFQFIDQAIQWTDTWHQSTPILGRTVSPHRGLFSAEYDYPAPTGPDWGWRIFLSQRPDSDLVLQMTNIAPWGEESRAVRMLLKRDSS